MQRTQNGKLAMILFTLYLVLYAGFMLINVFFPDLMETTPLAGVNLAIWYGFGLIISAILLAFIYGLASGSRGSSQNGMKGGE